MGRPLFLAELSGDETVIGVDAEPNGVGDNSCEGYAEIGALRIVLGHAALTVVDTQLIGAQTVGADGDGVADDAQ